MIFGLDSFAPFAAAIILVLLFLSFVYELRAPEVSALGAAAVMLVLGLISSEQLVGALSNAAPVTIGAMFIISAALVRTGVVDVMSTRILAGAENRPRLSVFVFLLVTAVVSAFMNNIPQMMMTIPIAIALAEKLKESSSRLLIPVSYATIIGGTITLIGTSTNILVDGVARKAGLEPFHILEIAPLGIVLSVIGVLFLTFTRRFLPERASITTLLGQREAQRYITEVVIEEQSSCIGQMPLEVKTFNDGERRVIDVIRGDASLRRAFSEVVLMEGDIVVMRTSVADLLTLRELGEIRTMPTAATKDDGLQPISTRKSIVVEILLAPGAYLIGRTLRHLRLRRRYGVYPIALHRRGANLADRFETARLEVGDTLLIEGAPEDLKRLVDDNDLVNVAEPTARPVRRRQAPIAIATLVGVIVGAAFSVMPIAGLATIGAAVVLATRCIEPDEAFEAVDWRILCLILAMLAIGEGLETSGLINAIVDPLSPYLAAAPPIFALCAVYLLAMTLTEIVTANAVGIIFTPIAIALAQAIGADPRPFVVAVMFAASASFMTPIGYQTNTLIYSVGGYKFSDYFRLGAPLNAICAIVSLALIPLIWPLKP